MTAAAAGPIHLLARRWRRRLLFADLLLGLAWGLVAGAIVGRAASPAIAAAAALLVAAALFLARARRRWPQPSAIARHLDRRRPRLEESSELLLEPASGLPPLARVQRRRAAAALAAEETRGLLPARPLWRAALALAGALGICVAIWAVPGGAVGGWAPEASVGEESGSPAAARSARPSGVTLEVRPPAYTGRPPRFAEALSTAVEEGAEVIWRLEVEGAADRAELVLDEERRVELAKQGSGGFEGRLLVNSPHLYRLRLEAGGREVYRGDYARLRLLRDRAPELEIVRPEERRRLLEPGATRLRVRVRAIDDHGVGETVLVATLAAGSGELVRFRERRLALRRVAERRAAGGGAEIEAAAELDLEELGMEPGTELYLFAEALDQRRPRPHRGRSATHVVRLPGERATAVDLGIGLPFFHLAEFFRSQRQIILDTERLLAEAPRITASELARRSEALGFDQRALRMRYAGLLGEEFESGSPLDEGEEDAEFEFADPEVTAADLAEALEQVPEGLTHSHDSAQRNTYFEDVVRSRLKAAMQEMWDAEGRLRGLRPRQALPYEYRALKLLKSAQEAERVYVRKVGFAPPPLVEGRRLSGDTDELRSQRRRLAAAPPEVAAPVRRALAAARELELDPGAVPGDFGEVMAAVLELLARPAAEDAAVELTTLDLLRRWADAPPARVPVNERLRLEGALWRLLPAPAASPGRRAESGAALWGQYRRLLAAE